MFTNSVRYLFVMTVLWYSHAIGSYQEQYNKVTVARNITTKTFYEIQTYTDGIQSKLDYFKENCKTNVNINSLFPCVGTGAFIQARLERVEVLLSYLENYVQGYPADLAALKPGLLEKIQASSALIQNTKKGIYNSTLIFENKSKASLIEATQKAIVDGTLKGKSVYYCTSFAKKIELYDLDFQILKSKNTSFSVLYQKYDEVAKFIYSAELFKGDCPGKMNFDSSSLVLKKFNDEISELKIIAYIKEQCSKIKNPDVQKQCLKPGEKKVDLLYSLFRLEKEGAL